MWYVEEEYESGEEDSENAQEHHDPHLVEVGWNDQSWGRHHTQLFGSDTDRHKGTKASHTSYLEV